MRLQNTIALRIQKYATDVVLKVADFLQANYKNTIDTEIYFARRLEMMRQAA